MNRSSDPRGARCPCCTVAAVPPAEGALLSALPSPRGLGLGAVSTPHHGSRCRPCPYPFLELRSPARGGRTSWEGDAGVGGCSPFLASGLRRPEQGSCPRHGQRGWGKEASVSSCDGKGGSEREKEGASSCFPSVPGAGPPESSCS